MLKQCNILKIGEDKPSYYKNILVRANPTLHEEVFEKIRELIPKNARIMDLGAGQGAFSQRLADNGYDVTSVDIDPGDFRARGVQFIALDFNSEVAVSNFLAEHKECYDAVIGMEVIEHVENPWDYVRLLKKLVKNNGLIVITTPNIESYISKITYLLRGTHYHFSDSDFKQSGHINPVGYSEITKILERTGLRTIVVEDICKLPLFHISHNIRLTLVSLFGLFLRGLFWRRSAGDILLVVARK